MHLSPYLSSFPAQLHHCVMCLDVLPSSGSVLLSLHSHSRETKTLANITLGNGSVLQRSEHLPLAAIGRASHEARSTLALVHPAADTSGGAGGGVLEGTGGGTLTHVAGVGGGEAQGTVGVNVDGLAAGDGDVQGSASADESGHVALGAGGDVGDGLGAVGRGLAAEVEVAAVGVQGEKVDGGGRAGGHDGEGTVGALGVAAAGGQGEGHGEDGEDGSELHCVGWIGKREFVERE